MKLYRFFREGKLLYTLKHSRWRKGIEEFANRIMIRLEFSNDVTLTEQEEVIDYVHETMNAGSDMKHIIQSRFPNDDCWFNDEVIEGNFYLAILAMKRHRKFLTNRIFQIVSIPLT